MDTKKTVLAGTAAAIAVLATPALAEDIDYKGAIKKACANNSGRTITPLRLAKHLVISGGYLPEDVADNPEGLTNALAKLARTGVLERPSAIANLSIRHPDVKNFNALSSALSAAMQGLQGILDSTPAPSDEKPAATVPNAPIAGRDHWLFSTPGLLIKCAGEPEEGADLTKVDSLARPLFVLRKSVDQLGTADAEGEWKKTVGGFGVGFTRTRSRLEDGSLKTDRSLKLDGVMGIRLSPATSDEPMHLYAGYTLSKDRSDPAPTLAAGTTEGDGDTDALELGMTFQSRLTSSESVLKLRLVGSLSWIRDFANQSSQGRMRFALQPGFSSDWGICNYGGFKPLIENAKTGLYTRCSIEIQGEAARIFKLGTSEFAPSNHFLALGGMAKFEAFAPWSATKADGIIASARYRRLPVLSGQLRDISRFDATLGYRVWSTSGLGFDVGLTYARGANDKSLERENKLDLGFGLIF